MNLPESVGGSSGRELENGEDFNGTDRPRKKARYEWQIKGKHHLKKSTTEAIDPDIAGPSSSGNDIQSTNSVQNHDLLGEYSLKQDLNTSDSMITDSEMSLLEPSTSIQTVYNASNNVTRSNEIDSQQSATQLMAESRQSESQSMAEPRQSETRSVAESRQSESRSTAESRQSESQSMVESRQSETLSMAESRQSETLSMAEFRESGTRSMAQSRQSETRSMAESRQSGTRSMAQSRQSETRSMAESRQSGTRSMAESRQSGTWSMAQSRKSETWSMAHVQNDNEEDECIFQWQARHLVQSSIDNILNGVTDHWIDFPLVGSDGSVFTALDVDDFVMKLNSL